ncbi:phosphoenolpyruvate--protein phosphotransferase [Nocardioides sp. KR10-350]|uniref:phosphoenolpyruvate--protein phosphotransferase n=1 Tax=Nocardioides cheoyonin TaxID=3156615 RepID=UPI0032B60F2E
MTHAQPEPTAGEPTAAAEFVVTNPHGLHARPAARLVEEARRYDATVLLREVDSGTGPVPASSLSRVATLAAGQGARLEVSASGPQAQQAVDAVVALAGESFGEAGVPAAPPPTVQPTGGPLPASPGIAIGPVVKLEEAPPELPEGAAGDPATEREQLESAVSAARDELHRVRARAAREVGEQEARIFDAQLALLDDPDVRADVDAALGAGASAARAWDSALRLVAETWERLPDPYLQARAADVRAVGRLVLRHLLGTAAATVTGSGILVAEDLTPAEVAGLDAAAVRGIVLAGGSPTGHAAILARARGLPAVVAAGAAVRSLVAGTTLALDGTTGEVEVHPSPDVVRRLEERAAAERTRAETALAAARAPAVTSDGTEVLVGANLGSVADATAAGAAGADVAGLVRTEFLYLGRDEAPSVEEQVETYRALARELGGRRLTLRTLDVGGDKPLPYAPQPAEDNPFLGVRGLRLALAERRLLHDQLEAVAVVARETPISLMFPMVSTVDELAEARELVEKAFDGAEPEAFEVGIMVEVPAAALKTASFAPHVDFLSIGTNDLTQYALAAERGNPAVAGIGDALDPGVLRLVHEVCHGAGDALVAVCGELAADPAAVPLLVALGVRELSAAPGAVPVVKEAVRRSRATDPDLVRRCLTATGPAEVRAILSGH